MGVEIRPTIVLGGPDKKRIKIVVRTYKSGPKKGETVSETLYRCN
jgi:hypothetical protein